jgi:hypothetical protein
VVVVVVKTRPRGLVLALLRQEVFVYVGEDLGQDPVPFTAAVLPCIMKQALQQFRRVVDMLALQKHLEDLVDRALGLGFAAGSSGGRCLSPLRGPLGTGPFFKPSRQIVPLQYLFDHSFDFCKACCHRVICP